MTRFNLLVIIMTGIPMEALIARWYPGWHNAGMKIA